MRGDDGLVAERVPVLCRFNGSSTDLGWGPYLGDKRYLSA